MSHGGPARRQALLRAVLDRPALSDLRSKVWRPKTGLVFPPARAPPPPPPPLRAVGGAQIRVLYAPTGARAPEGGAAPRAPFRVPPLSASDRLAVAQILLRRSELVGPPLPPLFSVKIQSTLSSAQRRGAGLRSSTCPLR